MVTPIDTLGRTGEPATGRTAARRAPCGGTFLMMSRVRRPKISLGCSESVDRPISNVVSQLNEIQRDGGTMLTGMARRVRDLSTRGAVLACFAFIVVGLPIAGHAQEGTKRFDIKAQPLSEALMAFGAQTGAIVMASSELTTGKISKPVTGQLTPPGGLDPDAPGNRIEV